ncbi:hypothetical protein HDU85_006132 [Gaertneriomyces sp. JEL0708]|nr:hypothetical protein HDU85_006132 [Gaertneriomyces sp. JEL0708]
MEAHGSTIFAKSKECLKVVGLIWMLGVGLIYIVSKHLGLEHIMSSHPWITALNIFISLPCALLCGLATPRGVIVIFRWTTNLALPLDHKRRLGDAISHLEFEIMALDNRLYNMQNAKPLPTTWPRAKSLEKMSPNDIDNLEDIPARIACLSAELEVLRKQQAAHPGLRLVGVALLLSFEVLGWVCVLTRMVSSLTRALVSENLLSYAILDPLPTWWSATEVVALVYFVLATAVGFHRLARTLILKPHATPARHIIGNISLLLVLSTSLPLVCGYLGLTCVMQHGPYQDLALLSRHPWALCLYKALMIWLIAITGRTR